MRSSQANIIDEERCGDFKRHSVPDPAALPPQTTHTTQTETTVMTAAAQQVPALQARGTGSLCLCSAVSRCQDSRTALFVHHTHTKYKFTDIHTHMCAVST